MFVLGVLGLVLFQKRLSYSLLQKTTLGLGPYEASEKVLDPSAFARLRAGPASKVLASQYWRSKIRGQKFGLKLKLYYANRPQRTRKWYQNLSW